MIEPLTKSSKNVLGYEVSGDVTKEDYATLDPAVEAAIKEYGSVRLLLDMTGFRWEKIDAWASDLEFGKEFRHHIEKLALVGDRKWEELLAKLAGRLYAGEARFFNSEDEAWEWLRK